MNEISREKRVLWMILFVFLIIVLVLAILSTATDPKAADLKSMPKIFHKTTTVHPWETVRKPNNGIGQIGQVICRDGRSLP